MIRYNIHSYSQLAELVYIVMLAGTGALRPGLSSFLERLVMAGQVQVPAAYFLGVIAENTERASLVGAAGGVLEP